MIFISSLQKICFSKFNMIKAEQGRMSLLIGQLVTNQKRRIATNGCEEGHNHGRDMTNGELSAPCYQIHVHVDGRVRHTELLPREPFNGAHYMATLPEQM